MPKNCVAKAFYLPPATGFRHGLVREFAALANLKIEAQVISATEVDPSLFKQPRGLAHPLGEIAYWLRYAEIVEQVIFASSSGQCPIFLLGFNFGGSIAAYLATAFSLAGMVVAGSIPRLTEFWGSSNHPVAASARGGIGIDLVTYQQKLRPYDLTSSLSQTRIPVLLQFGTQDDWIDHRQVEEIQLATPREHILKWYEDDHDMASDACMRDRWQFIGEIINKSCTLR